MPINIYNANNYETIDFICEDHWDLPTQVFGLEQWLDTKGKTLPKNNYVADIGFDIRPEANGGGSIINSKMIKLLSDIGMEIYLSEYPTTNKTNAH